MTHKIKELISLGQSLHKTKQHTEYSKIAHKVSRAIHKRKRIYYRRKYQAKDTKWWSFVNDTRGCELTQGAQPDLSEYTNMKCAPPPEPLFTLANVTNSISTLDGRAPGPDGISPNLLKAGR